MVIVNILRSTENKAPSLLLSKTALRLKKDLLPVRGPET